MPQNCLTCAAAGAVHVPADQLPGALQLAPAEWEAAYRGAKPGPDTWLVLQSRTCQRAAWAAQARRRPGPGQWCSAAGPSMRRVGDACVSHAPCCAAAACARLCVRGADTLRRSALAQPGPSSGCR